MTDECFQSNCVPVLTRSDQQWEEQAKQITDHVNWDRYLSLIQGRTAYGNFDITLGQFPRIFQRCAFPRAQCT